MQQPATVKRASGARGAAERRSYGRYGTSERPVRETEGSVQPRCGHAGGLRDENVCLGYLMRAFGIVGDGSEGDTGVGVASGR